MKSIGTRLGASTARYTHFRPHDTLHRFRNNDIDTVDVNANSAVDVFGTHTQFGTVAHTHTHKQQYAMEQLCRVLWGLKRV